MFACGARIGVRRHVSSIGNHVSWHSQGLTAKCNGRPISDSPCPGRERAAFSRTNPSALPRQPVSAGLKGALPNSVPRRTPQRPRVAPVLPAVPDGRVWHGLRAQPEARNRPDADEGRRRGPLVPRSSASESGGRGRQGGRWIVGGGRRRGPLVPRSSASGSGGRGRQGGRWIVVGGGRRRGPLAPSSLARGSGDQHPRALAL